MEGEMWKLQGGNSQIIEALAKPVAEATNSRSTNTPIESNQNISNSKMRLLLDTPVRSVKYNPDNRSSPITVGGETFSFSARHLIVAVPPPQIFRMNFTPPLLVERYLQFESFQMGQCIKTFSVFSEPFWRKAGCSGRALVSVVGDEEAATPTASAAGASKRSSS